MPFSHIPEKREITVAGSVIYDFPLCPNSTLASPTLLVIRFVSKYSKSGTTYFRLEPVRSRNSETVMVG